MYATGSPPYIRLVAMMTQTSVQVNIIYVNHKPDFLSLARAHKLIFFSQLQFILTDSHLLQTCRLCINSCAVFLLKKFSCNFFRARICVTVCIWVRYTNKWTAYYRFVVYSDSNIMIYYTCYICSSSHIQYYPLSTFFFYRSSLTFHKICKQNI